MNPLESRNEVLIERWCKDVALQGGYLTEKLYSGEIRFGLEYVHNGITAAWRSALVQAAQTHREVLDDLRDADLREVSIFRYADTYRYVHVLQSLPRADRSEAWHVPGLEWSKAYWKPRELFLRGYSPGDHGYPLEVEVDGQGPAYDEAGDEWGAVYMDRLIEPVPPKAASRPRRDDLREIVPLLFLELRGRCADDTEARIVIHEELKRHGIKAPSARSLQPYQSGTHGLPTYEKCSNWWKSVLSEVVLPYCAIRDLEDQITP